MRNYKVSRCKVESLKRGDKVLSKYRFGNGYSWYSFTFIKIITPIGESGGEGTLEITDIGSKYSFNANTAFHKVERDFPRIVGVSIDHLNSNII